MTNPVILLGTQSNGETLPVQVDATGRLVAEGLKGDTGDPGSQGPPGGSFPLPPDPYEGALLGWLDGELAWIGTPPVVLPEGMFGPILSYVEGQVVVEGKVLEGVENGVYLTQTDIEGNPTNPLWNQSAIWSTGGTSPEGDPVSLPTCFDGDETTKGGAAGGTLWTPPEPILYESSIDVKVRKNSRIDINGSPAATSTQDPEWVRAITGSGRLESLFVIRTDFNPWVGDIYMIKIDGVPLVDLGVPLQFRVNNVIAENTLIGVPTPACDLSKELYLKMPTQRVAPWVYYKNNPELRAQHLTPNS